MNLHSKEPQPALDPRPLETPQMKLVREVGQLVLQLYSTDQILLSRVNDILRESVFKLLRERIIRPVLEKYSVRSYCDGTVEFSLPAGSSPIDLLRDAKSAALSLAISCGDPGDDPTSLELDGMGDADSIESWSREKAFNVKSPAAGRHFVVQGWVLDTEEKTERQVTKILGDQGLQIPPKEILIAAHAVYTILTGGKDLTSGKTVRFKGGALAISEGQLITYESPEDLLNEELVSSSVRKLRGREINERGSLR